jgi:hypothetical protein
MPKAQCLQIFLHGAYATVMQTAANGNITKLAPNKWILKINLNNKLYKSIKNHTVMNKYQQGKSYKSYKIISKITDLVYIGSTIQLRLSSRLVRHQTNYKN